MGLGRTLKLSFCVQRSVRSSGIDCCGPEAPEWTKISQNRTPQFPKTKSKVQGLSSSRTCLISPRGRRLQRVVEIRVGLRAPLATHAQLLEPVRELLRLGLHPWLVIRKIPQRTRGYFSRDNFLKRYFAAWKGWDGRPLAGAATTTPPRRSVF